MKINEETKVRNQGEISLITTIPKTYVKALNIKVPDYDIQKKVVEEVFSLEKELKELNYKMETCLINKEKILSHYLK